MSFYQYSSLGDMVVTQSERMGDKVALLVPGKSGFTPVSYRQMGERVYAIATALRSLGLQRGDRLCIVSENNDTWGLTDWAAQTLGVVTVPIYPTLPPDQTQYIAKDCGAKVALVQNAKQAAKFDGADWIQVVPLLSEGSDVGIEARANPSLLSVEDWKTEARASQPEELATLIYTSGTTGHPKGVMLPHRCFTSLCANIPNDLPITGEDTFLSFLPLSHVFERFAGHILPISLGATIAYAGSLASLANDMQAVKPTVMLVVPRFLEATRARIYENAMKATGLRKKLFVAAMKQGAKRLRGESAPLAGVLDKIVGGKIRERLGGRMRFFVSGGAALPTHVSEFYLSLGVNVLQGYGLTETCAASCCNHPDDVKPETVGKPITGVELKIAGDGEILLRGPSVMQGYFNLPEDTKNTISPEGWLHTGDIGELDSAGRLKITDRKKDLLVLANGKNVAPQPIENKLKESEYINEAMLIGDGMEYCAALIVPEFDRITTWLKAKGETLEDTAAMVKRDDVRALIKSEIDRTNKTLADFEKVKKHELIQSPFSIDGGELTPSLKVRRRVVIQKYSELVDSLKR